MNAIDVQNLIHEKQMYQTRAHQLEDQIESAVRQNSFYFLLVLTQNYLNAQYFSCFCTVFLGGGDVEVERIGKTIFRVRVE